MEWITPSMMVRMLLIDFKRIIEPVFKFIIVTSVSGKSMVVDMWDVSLRGLSGRLLSVRQNAINTEYCLSFFYKLYGPNTGGFEGFNLKHYSVLPKPQMSKCALF